MAEPAHQRASEPPQIGAFSISSSCRRLHRQREMLYTQMFGGSSSWKKKLSVLLRCRSGSPGVRQRVNCSAVARAQAGVLLRRLKFALPGWAQAERRRSEWPEQWREQAAQRAAQARAYSGEGHSEEWRFEFSRPYPH